MIPVQAVAPIAEGIVKLLADYIASTKEPPLEVVAAWRRLSARVVEVDAYVQSLPTVPDEGRP